MEMEHDDFSQTMAGGGDRVADLLFDLNKKLKTTLVLVSHDRMLADRCDRVLELAAGRLVN